jgi:hypothetical protein
MVLRGTLQELIHNIGDDHLADQLAMDRGALCREEFPPRYHFNKYEEYDSMPKCKWYKSAEAFRVARV